MGLDSRPSFLLSKKNLFDQMIWKYKSLLPELLFKEIYTNGLLVTVGKNASAVALDHTGFAHRTVAHDHHLKQ